MTAQEFKLRTENLFQQMEHKDNLIKQLTEEVKLLMVELDTLG